jgi:hypothetical protein
MNEAANSQLFDLKGTTSYETPQAYTYKPLGVEIWFTQENGSISTKKSDGPRDHRLPRTRLY